MEIIIEPLKREWNALCLRPSEDAVSLNQTVIGILNEVKANGDNALRKFNERFQQVESNFNFVAADSEFQKAEQAISSELKSAIDRAYNNIYAFHSAQKELTQAMETENGVTCWREQRGIDSVGLYVPGGTAPLFSTVLMLGIPAQIAGCKRVQMCTPPNKGGKIHPAMLYAAKKCGISRIYKIGGAQAISAMAYGTDSIAKCYKIFGPGNQYVTKAKELVSQQGCAIDMPAGPSEVLVFADNTCNPAFVASDLLSQAEHGADSQVVLVSQNKEVVDLCLEELVKQIEVLPRKEMATKAIANSKAIVISNIDTAWDFINEYAPEHLIISSNNDEQYVSKIQNAGSVFLGNYTPESAGDYASGTNHTLPTSGYAKMYSGVNLSSFCTSITFQKINKKGIQNLGPTIEVMAENEGLFAHKNAVSLRLKSIQNEIN
jgi:histidinol dehydrogenase